MPGAGEMGSLIRGLASRSWEDRAAAQERLDALSSASEWEALIESLRSFGGAGSLAPGVCRSLRAFILGSGTQGAVEVFRAATGSAFPFCGKEDHFRELLEAFLSSARVSQRLKVQELTQLLLRASRSDGFPSPGPVLVWVIRALGQLRARQAVIHYEESLRHGDAVAFEVIRAVRRVRDPKSAVLLAGLFANPNSRIAAAAVEAYGDIGFGFSRAFRLYRLYFRSAPAVRVSILVAVSKLRPWVAARILARLHAGEADPGVRRRVIQRMGHVAHPVCARILLEESARNPDARLRAAAGRSFQALPAAAVGKAIRRALGSDDPRVRRSAILNTAQLPAARARKLLARELADPEGLEPEAGQALIEAVARMGNAPWAPEWLLGRIGGEPSSTVSAVSGFLQSAGAGASGALDRVLDAVERKGGQSFEATLSLMVDSHPPGAPSSVGERVAKHLSSESAQVRFLSACYLVKLGEPGFFARAWAMARDERGSDRLAYAPVFQRALSAGYARPSWVRGSGDEWTASVLAGIETAGWDLARWKEVLVLAYVGEEGMWKGFCEGNRRLWGGLVDRIVGQETDPLLLRALGEASLAGGRALGDEILLAMLGRLKDGEYADPGPAIGLIAAGGRASVLRPFADWVAGLPAGKNRDLGRAALCRWVQADG